jgi:hypothetical protein
MTLRLPQGSSSTFNPVSTSGRSLSGTPRSLAFEPIPAEMLVVLPTQCTLPFPFASLLPS